jgi:transmembrane sensor
MKEEELKYLLDEKINKDSQDLGLSRGLNYISGFEVENKNELKDSWRKFEDKINLSDGLTIKMINPQIRALKWLVAACFIGSLILLGVYKFSETEKYTKMAEHKNVVLPDGSFVMLNANSKINFNKAEWFYNKNIWLNGEAFFKVAKGKKFEVNTKLGKVIVRGTVFNVDQREKYFEVNCIEGEVLVAFQNKEVLLTQGMSTRLNSTNSDELCTAYSKSTAESISWIKGEFIFDQEPLKNVIYELERQFDVTFDISTNINKKYTGKFNLQNLDESLELVFKPLDVKYQQKQGNIYVLYN